MPSRAGVAGFYPAALKNNPEILGPGQCMGFCRRSGPSSPHAASPLSPGSHHLPAKTSPLFPRPFDHPSGPPPCTPTSLPSLPEHGVPCTAPVTCRIKPRSSIGPPGLTSFRLGDLPDLIPYLSLLSYSLTSCDTGLPVVAAPGPWHRLSLQLYCPAPILYLPAFTPSARPLLRYQLFKKPLPDKAEMAPAVVGKGTSSRPLPCPSCVLLHRAGCRLTCFPSNFICQSPATRHDYLEMELLGGK